MTVMKGRPKSINGCLLNLDRYAAPIRSPRGDDAVGVRRKVLAWKAGIVLLVNKALNRRIKLNK